MLRLAFIVAASVSVSPTQACSKSETAPAPVAPQKVQTVLDAGMMSPVGGGGSGAPSPSERRRGRRSIEAQQEGAAASAFSEAPEPPPFKAHGGAERQSGPKAVPMAEGSAPTNRIAMLATHLATMRKLRGGKVSSSVRIAVFDDGRLRTHYDRQALLDGQGRWLSAKLLTTAPRPGDASIEGAVGVIRARKPGWTVIYRYHDNRWVWSEVWRDRP